jgi:hypothetical protein
VGDSVLEKEAIITTLQAHEAAKAALMSARDKIAQASR